MVARQPGQVSNLDEYVTKGTWRSSGSIRSERQLGGQKGARLHLGVPLVVRPATRRVQESRSPLMTRHATLTSLRLILAFCRMMASVTIWAVASGKQTSKRIAGWWPVTPSTLSWRCLTTSVWWKQLLAASSPQALMTNLGGTFEFVELVPELVASDGCGRWSNEGSLSFRTQPPGPLSRP